MGGFSPAVCNWQLTIEFIFIVYLVYDYLWNLQDTHIP